MKHIFIVVLILLVELSFSQNIKLDVPNGKVSFNHLKEKVVGTIGGFDAIINLDLSNLEASTIEGSVKTASFKSGINLRDKHLQAKGYFNASAYPEMLFKSTSIEELNGRLLVKGLLTIKGIEKEVLWIFVVRDKDLKGTTTIFTNDFDVCKRNNIEKSKVVITVLIPLG